MVSKAPADLSVFRHFVRGSLVTQLLAPRDPHAHQEQKGEPPHQVDHHDRFNTTPTEISAAVPDCQAAAPGLD